MHPQKVRMVAILGSVLTGAALVFRFVGIYHSAAVVGSMNFENMQRMDEVTLALSKVTQRFAQAGGYLMLGNTVLLVGGALLTHAWTAGCFRARWFFRVVLTFSLLLVWQPLVGTVFGLLWFWLLYWDRGQFGAKPVSAVVVE